ncbi:Copper metabolism (Murr1) domain containing 1 [Chamberlinius hualienensis]
MATDNGSFEETALLNLLHAISQLQVFDNHDMTTKCIKSEIYPQLPDDEFNQIYNKIGYILKTISTAKMDLSQLQAFLTSRVKHREPAHRISDEQAKVIAKFWKSQSQKILESLAKRTQFNPALKDFNWRIDITNSSQALQPKNTAVVVLQMNLEDYSATTQSLEVEMDGKCMTKLFTSIKEIDNQIKSFVQKPLTNI